MGHHIITEAAVVSTMVGNFETTKENSDPKSET